MPLRDHAKVRVGPGRKILKKKVFPSVIQQLRSTVTFQVTEVGPEAVGVNMSNIRYTNCS